MTNKYNKSRLATKAERVARGVCRDCGKFPPLELRLVCAKCSDNRYKCSKDAADRRKANRQCAKCQNPVFEKTLCPNCMNAQGGRSKERRKQNRIFIYNHFGAKCADCGEDDIRVMTLDHVDNDGAIDKKTKNGKKQLTAPWYAKLVKSIKAGKPLPRRLQMLCYNCHFKKDLTPWWLQ